MNSILRQPKSPVQAAPEPVQFPPANTRVPGILRGPKASPIKMTALPNLKTGAAMRVTRANVPYKNWITDLIGQPVRIATATITKFRYPFRIVQIDDVVIDDTLQRTVHNELLITVNTPEHWTPSGFTPDAKKTDKVKLSNWYNTNVAKCIIARVTLSPF